MKNLLKILFVLIALSLNCVDVKSISAAGPETPQYGGTLTYLDMMPQVNPISWDNADWVWKHGYDTGFYAEHLLMGNLQKGPRGTKEYDFVAAAWIPPGFTRGELLERWEVKKNSLQIILHLRKGVFWQERPGIMSKREFVASDVVYNITRLKNSPKAVPAMLDFIKSMETPDKYTVIVNMHHWWADWYFPLGWGYYDAIQAPEQEKAPGGPQKWENATGTGPYMITNYRDGHSQTYIKNQDYWDSEIFKGKKYKLPFTDKVVMLLIKDEATQLASLTTGKIDLMMYINWKHVERMKKDNPHLQWSRYLYMNNFSMAMRMDRKPFNDIRVRRALNMAVDKKVIIDNFYSGNAIMHTYPFPPTFREVYTPLEKLPSSARELFSYDPAKAKKLLVEAGYPNGFTFKAQVPSGFQNAQDIAALVAGYLAKIGVTLELENLDYPSYMSLMLKKAHSVGYFFAVDHGGPFSAMRRNFTTGQPWNPHMMSDPYMDKTWEETAKNPNLTEKQGFEVIKKLAVYALDQAPAIILPTPYYYVAWWPWVMNYYGELRVGGNRAAPIISRIWIDQELKKKMGY
ncbi:MAG: ABC transporter substrate-binding protein [Deltaproteobacteria bacterium]|nr:ABC transporter substrate-binding protein [Deltaproteobacteria bacterium]